MTVLNNDADAFRAARKLGMPEILRRRNIILSCAPLNIDRLQFLTTPCQRYFPVYASVAHLLGLEDMREHLVAKHGFSASRVQRMRPETCYIVHDWLHLRKEGSLEELRYFLTEALRGGFA